MQQITRDERKPAGRHRTAEAAIVPLLCLVGTVAVLAVAGYVSLMAVWSAAAGG